MPGMPLALSVAGIREPEDWTMRKNGIDKLAFLVVLGAAVLVVLAAASTGPAYSDDSRTDPAQIHSVSTAETPYTDSTPAAPSSEPETQEPRELTKSVDQDGYEWSGSRPADERYLWSHRPN